MVGVALFCGAGIPACPSRAASFPCPARRPHPRTPTSNTLVVLTKTSPVLHGNVASRQYLRFQRMNPMKRPIATMAKPRYTYHPCSTVAETTAPRAESTSNRAALPLVSRFCSTTRASVLTAAMPTLHRAGAFPELKFSPTLASGTPSGPHDDTHAPHNESKFAFDPRLPARVPQCKLFPSPQQSAFESSPLPSRSSHQTLGALALCLAAVCP